jgi:hypothetical protein
MEWVGLSNPIIRINLRNLLVFPPFQIINHSDFYSYIVFTMYLNIMYIWVYNKNYVHRKNRMVYNLKQRDRVGFRILLIKKLLEEKHVVFRNKVPK